MAHVRFYPGEFTATANRYGDQEGRIYRMLRRIKSIKVMGVIRRKAVVSV